MRKTLAGGSSQQRPRVALLIETSNAYARGLLRGVMNYVREHRPWAVRHDEFRRGEVVPDWLKNWQPDGILARIENPAIAQATRKLKRPGVDLSAARLVPEWPCVETDDTAIGRLVAEHLLERGFESFAYLGDDRFNWSRLRRASFHATITSAGYPAHHYHAPTHRMDVSPWDLDTEEITAWVQELPKPVGVMAAWDGFGQQLLNVCREARISVPDEVAVAGVDNDEVICELSDPPLTSVATDPRRTGYEAAALLDQMLAGKQVPGRLEVIRPLGIVTRQSTDVLAIQDRQISAAVRYIRQHACDGLTVDDVLNQLQISRRVLETRFRKYFHRSPHQEIMRVQLQRVRQLLTETNLTLAVIADRAGFKHLEHMSVAFKRTVGLPPGEYRRQFRRDT